MIALWLCGSAWAIEPVIESVEAGQINWTTMELEITSRSDRTVGAWKDVRVQEQDALDRLKPLIEDAAKRVRMFPGTRAEDHMVPNEDPTSVDVARRINAGIDTWRVSETRYLSNGGVEMDGVLELHHWLRPALLALPYTAVDTAVNEGPTGLLIDARHLAFRPCLAPEVWTADETPLFYPERINPEVLRVRAPMVYVRDPADPHAAERVGDHPLFITAASSTQDCVVMLSVPDSQLLEASKAFPAVAASAKVVLVVSP
jgi:hypothetical protein